jgi:hypothetical protein
MRCFILSLMFVVAVVALELAVALSQRVDGLAEGMAVGVACAVDVLPGRAGWS